MQRALIASGVLGLGTALVFGAAALTATLVPNGPMVPGGFNAFDTRGGVMMGKPGMAVPMPAPPVIVNGATDAPIRVDIEPRPTD